MAFDAGAIEASLTVKLDQFDRDLDRAEARVKDFEGKRHEVKISAVFDQSDMSRARQMFAQLDQSISKDAMSRLRSSPQGSVLGALNALFSPHPVTGAPSASQAAQQGLLGKMISGQGGGVGSTGGRNVISDVIGVSDEKAKAQGARAGRAAADAASSAAKTEARKRGGFLGALLGAGSAAAGMLGGLGGHGGDGGGGEGGGGDESFLDKGLIGAIGPGILGMGFLKSSLVGLGGAAVGALPALTAAGLGAGVLGGGAALAIKGNKQLQAQAKGVLTSLEGVVSNAAKPLVKPLMTAFSQLGGFVKQIGPQIGSVFKAVVPFIAPVTRGLEGLVGGLLPGLVSILRAASPAMKVLSGFLAGLGSNLGKMFSQFSKVLGPSSVLLKALLSVVTGLLPFIGGLAQVLASVLAPAFSQFAGVIKGLLPSLVIIGKVVAQFAGAVLTDLAGGLGIVAGILKAVTPSISLLAGVLGQVFSTLENKGVLAQFGDILENLAGPIGNLINSLITGLLPVLPTVVNLFGTLVNILSQVATGAVLQLLTALVTPTLISAVTNLVTQLAILAAKVAPGVITAIAAALTAVIDVIAQPGVVGAITGIVNGLADLVSKVPAPVLRNIALALLAVAAGVKAIKIGQGLLSSLSGLVSTLKGIPSKIFGGSGAETVDVASTGMQKAGDTMLAAAEAMQKAARTMAGATVEGDAGAAGAGAEGAAAGEATAVGSSIGASLIKGGIIVAIAAAIVESLVKPTLQHKRISITDPQPGQNPNGNWWDNPAHANPLSANPKNQGLSTWAGLGTILKGWTGFGQSGSGVSAQQNARLASQHIAATPDPNAGELAWTKWWQDFDKTLVHPVTNWFTQSLPHVFTQAIPRLAWSPVYEGFMRDIGSPVSSWFKSSLPHAFTQAIPRLIWSPVYQGFMREIGSPVASWFTGTLPAFFTRMGGDVVSFFGGLPRLIGDALSGLGGQLLSIGESAMSSLVTGMESEIPGGSGIGHFVGSALKAVGFANGGLLTEPIVGFGTSTGQLYTLAENGPEWVVPSSAGGAAAGGSGSPGAMSQLAENLYIMQPEGSTIAQAFTELTWQLGVAKMQGFIGVTP